LALISTERRSPGKFLRLAWWMPGHDWLQADAVVVHARLRNSGDWVLGLRFLHLPRTSRAAIVEHVASRAPGVRSGSAPQQAKVLPRPQQGRVPGRWGSGVWKILPRDADELHELYQQALASVSNG
jgi:hypothetical protein